MYKAHVVWGPVINGATSSIGATYVRYWQQLITEVEGVSVVSTIYTDATAAERFLSVPLHTSKMKHIYIKWTFVREWVENGYFALEHYPGEDNTADMLTKVLPEGRQIKLYRLGVPGSELEDEAGLQGLAETKADVDHPPPKKPRKG